MAYLIELGDDFSEHEWEVEAKGWLDVRVIVDETEIALSFYDPVRLAQEVESSLARQSLFFEKNVVVVPKVNRENMEKAVEVIAASLKRGS